MDKTNSNITKITKSIFDLLHVIPKLSITGFFKEAIKRLERAKNNKIKNTFNKIISFIINPIL